MIPHAGTPTILNLLDGLVGIGLAFHVTSLMRNLESFGC